MTANYVREPISTESDFDLLTESGDELAIETPRRGVGFIYAPISVNSVDDDDGWDLLAENGETLTCETPIGIVGEVTSRGVAGVAQGVATFRLAGSVVATAAVGSAAGTATFGEAEPEIPDWLWGMHFAAAHKQNLKLRPLVGKVQATGKVGVAQGVASFKTPFELLLAKPRIDIAFEQDVRAIAAGLNVGLPETLAQDDLEPVFLALMMELADA